jgi:aldehyde dehydrogenase (NAD+)
VIRILSSIIDGQSVPPGRLTSDNPRADFIGDPRAGLFYHPVLVDGVRHGDGILRI